MPLLAACTQDLDSSGTCPLLCPDQEVQVQQVDLEPVVYDTTVAMFPLRGEEEALLAAWESGGVDSRVFYRFDATPSRYLPIGGDSVPIEVLHDAWLRVRFDTALVEVPEGAALEVYNVDGSFADADFESLLAQFTADRLLGVHEFELPFIADTLRISLDTARVLTTLRANDRIRLGIRATAPDGRVLVRLAPLEVVLTLNPTVDAEITAVTTSPDSRTPLDDLELRQSLASFMLVQEGTLPIPGASLGVGGMPGRRALMRFEIPPSILDSSSIVRATLRLTQFPSPGAVEGDSALLVPVPVLASDAVTDVVQAIMLSGHPGGGGLGSRVIDTLTLAANGSGVQEFELIGLLGGWQANVTGRPQRAIVLQVRGEGLDPATITFHSREADPGLRPRLRITYIPRIHLGIP